MRRFLIATVTTLTLVGALALPMAGRGDAAPYCGITWGSLPKQANVASMSARTVNNLRAGRSTCYDRLVIDLGPLPAGAPATNPAYWVSYGQFVLDGSGQVIPLAGGADLSITVAASAYDAYGRPTYRPANRAQAVNVSGFTTFRQVYFGGSFEGHTQVGLGVRARLPFRVFLLAGPGTGQRLVVDVAHQW